MTRALLIIAALVVSLCAVTMALADNHPASGFETNPLDRTYSGGPSGYSSEWDFHDITRTTRKPAPESLTQLERYMVAGTKRSALSDRYGLRPWKEEIWIVVSKFYQANGYVPDQLTPTEMRRIPDLRDATDEFLSIMRNPLTGEWPRLKDVNFSPGNVYIKPLGYDELRYYSILNPTYRQHWYNGYAPSTEAEYMKLKGKVWYIRMYGLKGVLCEQFYYVMSDY